MTEKHAAETKRYWIRLTPEAKKRLDFLAVEHDADSTEAYAGELLSAEVNKLWLRFDPKAKDSRAK